MALARLPLMATLTLGLGLINMDGDARRGSGSDGMSWFGTAIAVIGEEIAVGRAPMSVGPRGGGVHLFRRQPGGAWKEYAALEPNDNPSTARFGAALAASGSWLAVGAPGAANGGAVYLYQRTGKSWKLARTITLPDGVPGDELGAALAMNARLLVIGAPGRDSGRGAAFRLSPRGSSWSDPELLGRGSDSARRYGAAIALQGPRLLVGAPGPDMYAVARGQAVAVGGVVLAYRSEGTRWVADGNLVPSPGDSAISFGQAMVLAADQAWIGAPSANNRTGAVYQALRRASGWSLGERLTITPPAPDTTDPRLAGFVPPGMFGSAIALLGDQLLVGAPFTGAATLGAVHVFRRQGDRWVETQVLSPDWKGRGSFGNALVPMGQQLLVAAPQMVYGEGAVYTLTREGPRWVIGEQLMDQPFSLPVVTGGRQCDTGSVAGFGCRDVDLLAYLPVSAIGGSRGIKMSGVWGWTDGSTGREYALAGRADGTAFVDVTDPSNPKFLGDLPLTPGARPTIWREIKVYRDHAYIVSDGAGAHGMQVFDLTRLRNVANPPAVFQPDLTYTGIASAHNIVIDTAAGFAYAVGSNGGGETCGGALHIIDIRSPKEPKFVGCFADKSTGMAKTGYTHDGMCIIYRGPDTRFTGREICFNSSETAVGIADLTDKQNPRPIALATYPNTAYAHQGWITEDHRYFYLNDEGDEGSGLVPRTRTLVWDVSTLDDPVLVKEFLGTTAAVDHNLYIKGRYMYQANYNAGLRVIDISDPVNPVEVAFFDTVPWGTDGPGGGDGGAWSPFPFFRSGTILVTSMGEGLFILKHRERPVVP